MTANLTHGLLSSTRRIFLSHQRQMPDAALEELTDRAIRLFGVANSRGYKLLLTTGRESAKAWEEQHFGMPFNWEAWIKHVTDVTAPFSTEPRYHYFAVPEGPLGKATAQLLVAAANRGRTVFSVLQDRIVVAKDIRAIDSNNWKAGWELVCHE
jgi:hypothetical protein